MRGAQAPPVDEKQAKLSGCRLDVSLENVLVVHGTAIFDALDIIKVPLGELRGNDVCLLFRRRTGAVQSMSTFART